MLLRALAAAYGIWVLLSAIALGLVVGTIGTLPFVFLPRGRRERYTIWAAVVWARLVLRCLLFTRVVVVGAPGLGEREGALLICNHRSWLDPLLLIAYGRANGLSKKQIFWIPFIGLYGWLAGAVYVDRGHIGDRARARREVRGLVKSGARLQVFPEGTRSRDGRLREKVSLTLARDACTDGVTVLPCAVRHTERVLPVPQRAAWPFQTVELHFGEAMRADGGSDAAAFAQEAWRRVSEMAAMAQNEASADEVAPR